MKNLLDPIVPAGLVEVATGGYCTPNVQRNWVQREIFAFPIPEPRAGKPRMFSLLSVYEAAILSWAAQNHFPLEMIKRAFLWRKMQLLGGPGGWVEEEFRKSVEQGHFREFETQPDGNPAFWIIGVSEGYWAPGLGKEEIDLDPKAFLGVMAGSEAGIADAISRFRSPTVVINITEIVNSVDHSLEAAGWRPPA